MTGSPKYVRCMCKRPGGMPDHNCRQSRSILQTFAFPFLLACCRARASTPPPGGRPNARVCATGPALGTQARKDWGASSFFRKRVAEALRIPGRVRTYLTLHPTHGWRRVGGEHTASCGSLEGSSISILFIIRITVSIMLHGFTCPPAMPKGESSNLELTWKSVHEP